MKKTFISLCVAALFGSSQAHAVRSGIDSAYVAPGAPFTTTANNFTMVGATNGLTGGNNTTVFTWDGTYATTVVTDGSSNATLSSATKFAGYNWTAHHVNIYKPGTYIFYTGCSAGNPSCGTGSAYTLTVPPGKVGAHMLFDWNGNLNIDVVELWEMNNSWTGTGTTSPISGAAGTAAIVWNGVSIDTDMDPDAYSGTKMVDGPFVGQSANFSVNGILPFDETVPTLSGTSPANAAASVSPSTATYSVTFSEAMAPSSVNTGTPLTFSPAAAVGTPTTVDNITWNFPVTLVGLTAYTVTFNAGPTDLAGNALTLPANQSFTTSAVVDATSPTISAKSPAGGATGIAVSAPITVTFSEAMGGTTANAITLSEGATPVPCTFVGSVGNTVFTCTPATPLSSNTAYTVSVAGAATRTPSNSAAAQDGAGNNLITAGGNTWTFTTAAVTTLTTSGATVAIASGAGSMSSLSVVPSGSLGGTPPARVAMEAGLNYTINGVTGGSVTVDLTFPASIVGKTLYKVNAGTYTAIPESAFTRLSDFSIQMTIVNDGPYDTETTIPNTVSDPIAPGAPIVEATLGAAGGGGGCSVDPSGKDASLLVALLASLGYVGWRRRRN